MSVESAEPELSKLGQLEEALITYFRLSPDQVQHTTNVAESWRVGFIEAAIQLEFITHEDAARALAWARSRVAATDLGIVEAALRRRSLTYSDTKQPVIHVKPSAQLSLAHDQGSERSEQIRSLRTALLLLDDTARRPPLALLSPCAGEGRSQLAAELAIAFSQLGRKTLLVDADLRRPRQQLLFSADNDRGLAQVLSSGETTAPYGVEGLPDLFLLTSGQRVPNPLEVLSDGRFERMLKLWRFDYDFIVIDTPPVSEYADGLLIASLATRVLALSRADFTQHSSMQDMLRRLAATQCRILGAVINHF
jgi:receptor protein-tyrosine kinase